MHPFMEGVTDNGERVHALHRIDAVTVHPTLGTVPRPGRHAALCGRKVRPTRVRFSVTDRDACRLCVDLAMDIIDADTQDTPRPEREPVHTEARTAFGVDYYLDEADADRAAARVAGNTTHGGQALGRAPHMDYNDPDLGRLYAVTTP